MNQGWQKAMRAVAIILVLSITQVYIQTNLALPGDSAKGSAASAQTQIAGKLVTRGSQPVLVNGNNASTGATILTNSVIETPDGVSATVNLGALGSLDIAPNTTLSVEFVSGEVRVRVVRGCLILKARRGVNAQISTDQGIAAKNDPSQQQALDVCVVPGVPAPIVNQGAAANAGAGAGMVQTSALAPGLTGTSTGWGVGFGAAGIFAGIFAPVFIPCRRGRNPSPGVPRGPDEDCRRGF